MDLSKLNDDQVSVALKVIDSAKRHGINPDWVLPMVNIESGFKSDADSGKAYGPMQLTPATAKELGVDPHNVDENIEGGMKYLKSLIDNPKFNNDPHNIFAAYNAGPNAKYFQTGNFEDLPDETVNHVVKVMNSYGDQVPSMTIEAPEQKPVATENVEATPEDPYGGTKIYDLPAVETSRTRGEAGAALGAIGAGVGAVKVPVLTMAHRLTKLLPGKKVDLADAAKVADTMMGLKTNNLPPAQGPYPAKNTGTANYGKAFGLTNTEASRAVDMSKRPGGVWDLVNKAEEANQKIGPGWTSIPERADLLLPTSAGSGPRGQTRVPIPPVAPPQAPKAPGLASKVLGTVAGSSPVVGGLAAYGMGYGAQDAYNKYQQGDIPGAVTSGLQAAASGAALVPKWAPFAGAASSALDAERRMREKDYIGALTSALGAAGPYIAPFALGPEVGVPVGIGMALGSPMANELKDWIQKKMSSE